MILFRHSPSKVTSEMTTILSADTTRRLPAGDHLRAAIASTDFVPLMGIYDVFSATLAANHFDGLFVSGFGFGASHYGLPDMGFNSWSDIVAFVQRIRTVLPAHHVMVDIDDGFGDVEVACHVVALLEAAGASGVILEDQARPRRCGHFDGKRILPLEDTLERLNRVLQTRNRLFVVARTDASGRDEILRRVAAYSETAADAILVDGIGDTHLITEIRAVTDKPLAFNQISGGASKARTFEELRDAGVALPIYSTPCLFAAQAAITDTLNRLQFRGSLNDCDSGVALSDCNEILVSNLLRRDIAGIPNNQKI
jgi:2-methylisocitrate lyase-like PEP mutase family enzyme